MPSRACRFVGGNADKYALTRVLTNMDARQALGASRERTRSLEKYALFMPIPPALDTERVVSAYCAGIFKSLSAREIAWRSAWRNLRRLWQRLKFEHHCCVTTRNFTNPNPNPNDLTCKRGCFLFWAYCHPPFTSSSRITATTTADVIMCTLITLTFTCRSMNAELSCESSLILTYLAT